MCSLYERGSRLVPRLLSGMALEEYEMCVGWRDRDEDRSVASSLVIFAMSLRCWCSVRCNFVENAAPDGGSTCSPEESVFCP